MEWSSEVRQRAEELPLRGEVCEDCDSRGQHDEHLAREASIIIPAALERIKELENQIQLIQSLPKITTGSLLEEENRKQHARITALEEALAKSCCDVCGGLGEEPQEVEEKMCKQCNGTGHVSP